MQIVRRQIRHNVTPLVRSAQDIRYVNLHDTGNTQSGADAKMHYEYFDSQHLGASADVFVDDKGVWIINDWYKHYTWAVGDDLDDSDGNNNRTSINVEMCINEGCDANRVYRNTLRFVSLLQQELPHAEIQRHYDASDKICPAMWAGNSWAKWYKFLLHLRRYHMGMSADEIRDLVRQEIGRYLSEEHKVGSREEFYKWAQPALVQGKKLGIYSGDSHEAREIVTFGVQIQTLVNQHKVISDMVDDKLRRLDIVLSRAEGNNAEV